MLEETIITINPKNVGRKLYHDQILNITKPVL